MAKPYGARSEATRKSIRRSRKIRGSGQPGKRIVGDTERPRSGATRILASRHRRRMRPSRQLGDPSLAKPEVRDEGQPETFIAGVAGGREVTGRLGASLKPATPKECDIWGDSNILRRHGRRTEDSGQPGASVAEAAAGCGVRGNPETQTWLNRKMQGARQLATSSTG
jgi:hypothetical protein